ncbi:MAG TPA: hypothetical protein VF316_10655 [Polyangiaceae bacterium]
MRTFWMASTLISLVTLCHCNPSDPTTPTPDGGAVNTCAAPTGPGTKHGGDAVTTDTVWRAADGPHTVTFGFSVQKGATLTIEPCAEVRIQGGYGITVNGTLKAEGTASQPIHVVADDATKPWSGIIFYGGTGSFSYATLENGGDPADPNILALLDLRDTNATSRQELVRLDHVTLKTSAQFGLSLRSNATLTKDSDALTISGAKLGPVRTWPGMAGNIPAGTYTGNDVDEINVVAEDNMNEDTTWHARGVPYRLGNGKNGNDMRVGKASTGSPKVTFTVEAGVTVKVTAAGRILMSLATPVTTGVLVANGTADKPIVFTSASPTPAAGDWTGLWFDGPEAANHLDYVHVDYAGGPSQAKSFHCDLQGTLNEAEDSAILIFGQPPSAFVTNSTITNSAGYGVGRAWSGDLVDFVPTNTFAQNATCKESYPRDKNGACPATVPCP